MSKKESIPVRKAVGMVLAHDITEIRKGEFKGRAFKKGCIIREEDIPHLLRLGKEHLFVIDIAPNEVHEDEAAEMLSDALTGNGVEREAESKEGKINIIASMNGLLKIDKEALKEFNMLGEIMCSTKHSNSVVKKGEIVAATRAIPLIVKREIVEKGVQIAGKSGSSSDKGIIEVKTVRKPKVGLVVTGGEVFSGKVKDEFTPLITRKVGEYGGEILGAYIVPDDAALIEKKLRELLNLGADLLVATGGMSVDPDDVTRFAVKNLGVSEFTYGSPVLPGSMFLVAYLKENGAGNINSEKRTIPVIGIPACGMYNKITVFDLLLPRILADEYIGREELAEMGHGGFCLNCKECKYPVCPFGR